MCRVCGRFVRCIFDTMPSRIYTVPSRRAFSTMIRQPMSLTQSRIISPTQTPRPISNLSQAFSGLSISSQTKLPCPTTSTPIVSTITSIQIRAFSASAVVGAPRRTFNPSRRVQKRRSGYLARAKDPKGQLLLKRRIAKGRKHLSW